jgi:hypothetical protein
LVRNIKKASRRLGGQPVESFYPIRLFGSLPSRTPNAPYWERNKYEAANTGQAKRLMHWKSFHPKRGTRHRWYLWYEYLPEIVNHFTMS